MKDKKIALNTIATGGGMLFFQVSNFLLGVFIVRYIGAVELGNYQLFVATSTFLSYIAKMGYDEKVSYELPKVGGATTKEGQSLIASAFWHSLMLSLLITSLYLLVFSIFFATEFSSSDMVEVAAYAIYFPCFVGGLILTSVLRAEQLIMLRSVCLYVLPNIFNISIIFLVSWLIERENSSLLSRSLTYLIILIFLFFWIKRTFGISTSFSWKIPIGKEFGWFAMTAICFVMESGLIAIWYSKYYLVEAEFGALAILIRLAALLMLTPIAVSVVMGPLLAKKVGDIELISKMFKLNIIGVFFAGLGMYLFSKYLLLFFGEEFLEYQQLLFYLSIAMAVLAIVQPINSVLISEDKKKLIFIPGLFAIILFCFLCQMQNARELSSVIFALIYSMIFYSLLKVALYFYSKNKVLNSV